MRFSDLKRRRKLQFGQAVLLGVEIGNNAYHPGWDGVRSQWYRRMPSDYKRGYINGPYPTRHAAVTAALCDLGVISSDGAPLPDAAIYGGD